MIDGMPIHWLTASMTNSMMLWLKQSPKTTVLGLMKEVPQQEVPMGMEHLQ
jgi:hypothetical protein